MDTKMTIGLVQLQVNLPGWLLYIKKPSQTIGSDNWMLMSDEINASEISQHQGVPCKFTYNASDDTGFLRMTFQERDFIQ
ncbi:hypothetical protein NC652_020433 [Populus alba x Populus x berolinensis]|nr:hypothetical protein NC652_020433 [Populus alba x Populus x berolinensis]